EQHITVGIRTHRSVPRRIGLGDGRLPLHYRDSPYAAWIAIRLVPPIPARRTVWFQYYHATCLVDRSPERFGACAGAWISAVDAGAKACGVDRALVVVVGMGSFARLPTFDVGIGPGL